MIVRSGSGLMGRRFRIIILSIIGCVANIISGIGNCPKMGIVGEKKLDVNVVFGII